MIAAGQLPLPLGHAPHYGRADFLIGRTNEQALAYLERYPRWLAPAVMLIGPEGSGKSHLAALFSQENAARLVRADHVTRTEVPSLALAPALVVEDADRFPCEEAALFHLLNMARESGHCLVLTARKHPDFWGLHTPDLLSRLRALPLLTLEEPDEGLLSALLVKLFDDRQLRVDAPLIPYILARAPRSYAGMIGLVEALDSLSLTRRKPITRALVAEVLGVMEEGE